MNETLTAPVLPPQKKRGIHMFAVMAIILAAILAIVLALIVLKNPGGLQAEATEQSTTILITDRGMAPPVAKVKKGSNVVWVNQSNASHQLVLSSPNVPQELEGFNTDEPLAKGDSYSFTFDASGTFTYEDPSNPQTVHGTVTVE
jgi:plastocyanin